MSVQCTWRIIQDLDIIYKQPKLNWKEEVTMRKKEEENRMVQENIVSSLKKILLGFEDETWLHLQPYITRTYMMKGEQQKILHKGSNDKVNVFILIYILNRINFQYKQDKKKREGTISETI